MLKIPVSMTNVVDSNGYDMLALLLPVNKDAFCIIYMQVCLSHLDYNLSYCMNMEQPII